MEKKSMVNFKDIKHEYRKHPMAVLQQLVGAGEIRGSDYVALNPRRKDSKLGSFRIDVNTGKFYDFATGDRGSSIIDLAMFVYNCGIVEAAQRLEGLFPFLACQPLAVQGTLAKKKEVDIRYIWRKSIIAEHEYLKNKKISLGNALVNSYKGKSQLVIPLMDRVPDESVPEKPEDFEIKALQFIDKDGNKRFSGSFKGLFHIASDYERSKEEIVISEGYATARSIVQSTDFFVIGAMSSINIKNVAEKIAEQFPNSKIIIAADNDEAGEKAAESAKESLKDREVEVVYPTQGFKDFNDMYQVVGAEGVRNIFCLNEGVR